MNYKDIVIQKLKKYKKEDIIITNHAIEQAVFRGIRLEEVKENLINPQRLAYAEKQEALKKDEEKYNCYFGYSNTQCHRYAFTVNKKCIVVTIMKIKRRWQHEVEKNASKV
jgi:hypothetical protein